MGEGKLDRSKEVIEEMDMLGTEIGNLESIKEDLLKRLETVLSAEPPINTVEDVGSRTAPHAENLACYRRRVVCVINGFRNILTRLEI